MADRVPAGTDHAEPEPPAVEPTMRDAGCCAPLGCDAPAYSRAGRWWCQVCHEEREAPQREPVDAALTSTRRAP